MSDNDIEKFVEVLYPYIIKKIKQDGFLKNVVKSKNATVVSVLGSDETNIDKSVDVRFVYDTNSFPVTNRTGVDLNQGDIVNIEYWVDLKNAVAVYKVN